MLEVRKSKPRASGLQNFVDHVIAKVRDGKMPVVINGALNQVRTDSCNAYYQFQVSAGRVNYTEPGTYSHPHEESSEREQDCGDYLRQSLEGIKRRIEQGIPRSEITILLEGNNLRITPSQ